MMIIYLIIILVGASFAALNADSVQVNFYFTKVNMPISVLITIMLGVGLIIGFLLFLFRYWRLKVKYSRLQSKLRLTEKEIKNLRSIPLQDQH